MNITASTLMENTDLTSAIERKFSSCDHSTLMMEIQ
jgi:hypothetical protein